MLQGVAEFVEKGFEVLVALLFSLEEVAQVGLELCHAGVEVDLFIAVAELDVLAGHEAPTFLLNLGEGGTVAVFGLVVVGLFKQLFETTEWSELSEGIRVLGN